MVNVESVKKVRTWKLKKEMTMRRFLFHTIISKLNYQLITFILLSYFPHYSVRLYALRFRLWTYRCLGGCPASSASEILICIPALVVVTGGELEIFGMVLRSSK